ncbi:type ii cytoskeletal hypothetical protein [Limosa lapponica baueri]|uniref:Uncharacterized protein n=1 Tax=Limosa lapponica baueri TaxID=1758121 RepID=A0A2I0T9A8_LIMLA|nr:type ii cytoskeletal hypothetical protein [Limosa lapponica baueri]
MPITHKADDNNSRGSHSFSRYQSRAGQRHLSQPHQPAERFTLPCFCSLFAIQELEELLTEIKDISVVLGIDNVCKLDLSRIVEEVRTQYEALALRSWEEAEALTRRKVCFPRGFAFTPHEIYT